MMVFQSYVTGFMYIGMRASKKSWHLYSETGYIGEALMLNDLVKIGVYYDASKDDTVEADSDNG